MIEIKVEENLVNLYKDDRESPIYTIRKDELLETRTEDGNEISEWIDQLVTKTWMEDNTLYELAVLINKEFPENGINWAATFFPVEKRQYLNHVKVTKQLASDDKKPVVNTKSIFDDIKTGVEESNSFVNGKISKIVEANLQKYGL